MDKNTLAFFSGDGAVVLDLFGDVWQHEEPSCLRPKAINTTCFLGSLVVDGNSCASGGAQTDDSFGGLSVCRQVKGRRFWLSIFWKIQRNTNRRTGPLIHLTIKKTPRNLPVHFFFPEAKKQRRCFEAKTRMTSNQCLYPSAVRHGGLNLVKMRFATSRLKAMLVFVFFFESGSKRKEESKREKQKGKAKMRKNCFYFLFWDC